MMSLDCKGDKSLGELKQPYRAELSHYRRATNFVVGDQLRIVPNKADFDKFLVTLQRVNGGIVGAGVSRAMRSGSGGAYDGAFHLKYTKCFKRPLPFYIVAEGKDASEKKSIRPVVTRPVEVDRLTGKTIGGGKETHEGDGFISIEGVPDTRDDIMQLLLKKRSSIQRQLNDHATTQLWLDMAQIQDTIAQLGSKKLKLTRDQKMQMDFSVYGSALKSLPNDPELVLRYMDSYEGLAIISNGFDINAKWKNMCNVQPKGKERLNRSLVTDTRIWERRIDALLLNTESDFTDICTSLEEVFADVGRLRQDPELNGDIDAVYHACLGRLFSIWDTLGYTTWTVGLIQALFEQAFFPQFEESLQEFWKTRQPRLGDSRSQGWKYSSSDTIAYVDKGNGATPFDEVLFEDIEPYIQESDKLSLLWTCLLHLGLIVPGATLPTSLQFETSGDELVNDPQITSKTIHMCELVFREVDGDPSLEPFTSWWGNGGYTAGSPHDLFKVATRLQTMASQGLAFDPRVFSLLEPLLETEPGWCLFLAFGQLAGLDRSFIRKEAVSRMVMSYSWWKAYIDEAQSHHEKMMLSSLALRQLPWSRDLHLWLSRCEWLEDHQKETIRKAMMRREMNVSLEMVQGKVVEESI